MTTISYHGNLLLIISYFVHFGQISAFFLHNGTANLITDYALCLYLQHFIGLQINEQEQVCIAYILQGHYVVPPKLIKIRCSVKGYGAHKIH